MLDLPCKFTVKFKNPDGSYSSVPQESARNALDGGGEDGEVIEEYNEIEREVEVFVIDGVEIERATRSVFENGDRKLVLNFNNNL